MSTEIENKRSKLLVLVSDDDLDEVRYARKARTLAETYHLDTRFIGMVGSSNEEPGLRRKLVTLSGITEAGDVRSDFMESASSSWLDIATREFKPGDHILCPRELEETIIRIDSAQSLRARFGSNLSLVTGMINPSSNQKVEKLLLSILNWAGILVIMGVAFLLESDFDSQTIGSLRIVGDVIIVGLEVYLLWTWYRLFQKIHN